MSPESAPKPTKTIETIKLDKSRPYIRARSTLPLQATKEDLGPARQELAQALSEAWRAYDGNSDRGRLGVRLALAAACDFITAADRHAGEIFDRLNTVLIAALSDLDKGVTAPLLKKGAGQDRETDSFAYKDVQRRAAATMAGLMDAGYLRDDAAKKVTATLTRNGFSTTQRAVEKWYDERLPAEVKRRKGRPPKSALGEQNDEARLHYVVNQARGTAEYLLDELTWFTRLWFPSPQKGRT
jgi:hypothetical protein